MVIKDNNGPLFTYIRYPQSGGTTDYTIARWAQKVREDAEAGFAEVLGTDAGATGEINVHFDSYLFDGKFAGVLELGFFTHSHLAHPVDIVKTFNIDITRQTFLENDRIIDPAQSRGVLALLQDALPAEYPEAAGYLGEMDESWLSTLAIGSDGVIVVLERGVFLPGYLGTLTVTLPYDRLGPALILGSEPPSGPGLSDPPDPSALPSADVPIQSGNIDPNRPMVALTFDDGPSKYTSHILDILEQYGVRATFFVVGNLVNSNKNTVLRAMELGCEVAGHSWDHKNLTKLNDDELRQQITDTSNTIKALTDVALPFFRPPYGAVNERMQSVARELGVAMINWTVDPLDWKIRDADIVCDSIMRDVRDGYIILSHDMYRSTAEAMERVIPELIRQGYQLVTVSELLHHAHGGTLEAGRVYVR
jgi:peptidoglycan/xylan/chitin deacetylase (PgdA/CDA1 family)